MKKELFTKNTENQKENDQMLEHQLRQEIILLEQEVLKHDFLYSEGRPIISDSEYDDLYLKLVSMEKDYMMKYNQEKIPEFMKDSPTQKINDIKIDKLTKVKHSTPMLSQEKIKSETGIDKFLSRADDTVLVQEKLDGLTAVLIYENSELVEAATRGNGFVGFSIMHIAKTLKSIPKKIKATERLVIRGELIIPKSAFNEVNQKLPIESRYKTARNLASGTVINLDGRIAKDRGLTFKAFELVNSKNKTEYADLVVLCAQGFDVVSSDIFLLKERNELKEYVLNYSENFREKLDHDIDGLVLKFNSKETQELLGYTSKYPKWACAYKFASMDTTTKLIDVYWTVGKNGQVTPVGVVEPCEIDGVTITKASLANYSDIVRRDLKIGDTVQLIRANDVIPKITMPIIEERTGGETEILPIKDCPSCGSELIREDDGVHSFCQSLSCEAQKEAKIQHYMSRNAMNIDGLGDKTVQMLIEKGFLNTVADIYQLHERKSELENLESFGEKKITKMLEGIEASKKQPLQNVLYGLSIQYVGEGTSKRLVKEFFSIQEFLTLSKEDLFDKLISIEDIGESTAKSICSFFSDTVNHDLIEKLLNCGVEMIEEQKEIIVDSNISGKTFVITGKLSKGRKEFANDIEAVGGKVSGSVSKKTDYLLMGEGEEGSSKHKKALELGVKIISEEDFNALLK